MNALPHEPDEWDSTRELPHIGDLSGVPQIAASRDHESAYDRSPRSLRVDASVREKLGHRPPSASAQGDQQDWDARLVSVQRTGASARMDMTFGT
jgi:hypothetical protein